MVLGRCVLYVKSMPSSVPSLRPVCCDLGRELSSSVSVSVIISFSTSSVKMIIGFVPRSADIMGHLPVLPEDILFWRMVYVLLCLRVLIICSLSQCPARCELFMCVPVCGHIGM